MLENIQQTAGFILALMFFYAWLTSDRLSYDLEAAICGFMVVASLGVFVATTIVRIWS